MVRQNIQGQTAYEYSAARHRYYECARSTDLTLHCYDTCDQAAEPAI